MLETTKPNPSDADYEPVREPDNDAYRSLQLKLGPLSRRTTFTKTVDLPPQTVFLDKERPAQTGKPAGTMKYPPSFVQPHPPYEVFPAPVFGARALTRQGAEKRTYHFDIDVTEYPEEGGVDFKTGGAIGICPANSPEIVDEVFDLIGVPSFVRDRPVTLRTTGGRWPTIWGDEKPRSLVTTRRELLTWCSDLQSYPPTKPLLRLLAEYAFEPNERRILTYLSSAEGQMAFCDLRTGGHITIAQLLNAFPSSKPPLEALLSTLNQLMPRFYSLSNDPHVSSAREGLAGRRIIEMAVTIHESNNWRGGPRTGVGSGFLERVAEQYIKASAQGPDAVRALDLRIPMFRGLMANPLSREFGGDGPMMLIGAGVGMAPFRGFILNRLRNANCANKIWLVQGVRDSSLDELYQGELGAHEKEIKRVVQSRVRNGHADVAKGSARESRYVQDEVRAQADIVWFVINALDGRIFVCGSTKGMGEGVERALVDVAMEKGGLNEEEANAFWEGKKSANQYIAASVVRSDQTRPTIANAALHRKPGDVSRKLRLSSYVSCSSRPPAAHTVLDGLALPAVASEWQDNASESSEHLSITVERRALLGLSRLHRKSTEDPPPPLHSHPTCVFVKSAPCVVVRGRTDLSLTKELDM